MRIGLLKFNSWIDFIAEVDNLIMDLRACAGWAAREHAYLCRLLTYNSVLAIKKIWELFISFGIESLLVLEATSLLEIRKA